MVRIERLKERDVTKYRSLIRKVILKTPYYSAEAKKRESQDYSEAWFKSGVKNSKRLNLCGKDGNDVVAFLFGYLTTGMVHLIWLGVDKEYRRRGLAEKMMLKAEQWAKTRAHKILFDTRINNKESITLAKKLGYRKAAMFKKHYYGQDFYIWEKLLR